MTAALPELPYQIGIKLMTLAAAPVGIDESTRAASVPRQMYDIDLLLAGLDESHWTALSAYCAERYAEECERFHVGPILTPPPASPRLRARRLAPLVVG